MFGIFKRKTEAHPDFDNKHYIMYYLGISGTRKCNLACEHCMRGDAQNKDISKETLDKIFDKFNIFENLSLEGGELSLAPNMISDLTSSLKKHKTTVRNLGLTTNGVEASDEFIAELIKLKEYVDECNEEILPRKNKPRFNITVSTDDFHLKEMIKKGYTYENLISNIQKYREVFGDNSVTFKGYCDFELIDEGRAKNIAQTEMIKKHIPKPLSSKFGWTPLKHDFIYFSGLLAVSVDGEVLPDCNLSYENQEVFSVGNIKTTSLNDMFKRLNVRYVKRNELQNYVNKILNDASVNLEEYEKYTKTDAFKKNERIWSESAPKQNGEE